jgi:hypothetical protein
MSVANNSAPSCIRTGQPERLDAALWPDELPVDGRSLRNAQIFEIDLSFFDGRTDGPTDLGRQLGALDQARLEEELISR